MTKITMNENTINQEYGNVKKWVAALYLRTARSDGDKEESASIVSQRELLQEFVGMEHDIEVYDVYADDGWSGLDFERPAFRRMMGDIHEKRVDCVIVKDISRLGRGHMKVGWYLEEIFLPMDIRFISLTDCVDSVKDPQSVSNIMFAFKSLINEAYCRDISNKVRRSLDMRRKRGRHIGSFAPFGYKKDPDNHNHIVIDGEAADTVRDIFSWCISGMSILSISRKLNEMGVPNPSKYKKKQDLHYYNPNFKENDGRWTDSTVRRILKNRMYVGDMVQGVTRIKSYREQVVERQCPEDWIIVENTHDPIISREEFRMVQDLIGKNKEGFNKKKDY